METMTTTPAASPAGCDETPGGSVPLSPRFVSYTPSMSWVRLRLEDANYAFRDRDYDSCKTAVNLANAMMRCLELEAHMEARS